MVTKEQTIEAGDKEEMTMEKHTVSPETAGRVKTWLRDRGGLAVWQSVNLSNLGQTWTTPALTEEGQPYPKPSWKASDAPRIITDLSNVTVRVSKEVKRFHIAIRPGAQGLNLKLTDGSKRKLDKALDTYPGSWYRFDHSTQEAVILVTENEIPLDKWDND